MKKALSLLFISSSMFSMQLAHRIQAPRFIKQSVAMVKSAASKDIVSEWDPVVCYKSIEFNTPKFKIDSSSIRAPHYVGDIELYHGKKGFVVVQDGERQLIEKVLMNETAREITKKNIKSFLKSGFLALNQTGDGKFTLKAHHRLTGGGPLLGAILYWMTKTAAYGTCTAAIASIATATGGFVVTGASCALATVGSGAVVTAAGTSTAATVLAASATTTVAPGTIAAIVSGSAAAVGTGSAIGATVIGTLGAAGTTVAGVGIVQAATLTTAAGVVAVSGTSAAATMGTGAAIVAGIESAALAAGALGTAIPFLP